MHALESKIGALAVDSEVPTLLDALARAPAAAALVVRGLEEADDRAALRLAHSQLRDAVNEATTFLAADFDAAAARPPTPARWPRLAELRLEVPGAVALGALGLGTWPALRVLALSFDADRPGALDGAAARAVAAALRRMPALEELDVRHAHLSAEAPAELFSPPAASPPPPLRSLVLRDAGVTPAAARALAASGWRLEELDLSHNDLGSAGLAALLAAPTFALRRVVLYKAGIDATCLGKFAGSSWPLEELELQDNDFSGAAAAPAIAALSRQAGLRTLNVGSCELSAASFKALVEASWPALARLNARFAHTAAAGDRLLGRAPAAEDPPALGAGAFAGFPALVMLELSGTPLYEAGARLLARRWPRLRELNLVLARLGDAGAAALARGSFPALKKLRLAIPEIPHQLVSTARHPRNNGLSAPLALADVRRWAPALEELYQ